MNFGQVSNYLDFVSLPALPFAILKNYLLDNLLISTVTVLLCSVNLKNFKTLEEYSFGSIYKKYLAPHKILKEVQSHTAKAWRHLADCGVDKECCLPPLDIEEIKPVNLKGNRT